MSQATSIGVLGSQRERHWYTHFDLTRHTAPNAYADRSTDPNAGKGRGAAEKERWKDAKENLSGNTSAER